MTRPDPAIPPDLAAALPRGDGPVFRAPWQARIFALIVGMVQAGHLPWPDFQRRLAARITAMEAGSLPKGAEAVEEGYFGCWLGAVEEALEARDFIAPGDVAARIAALRDHVAAIRAAQTGGA